MDILKLNDNFNKLFIYMTKIVVKIYKSIYCDQSSGFTKLIMVNIYSKFFIGLIKINTSPIPLNNKNKFF